MPAHTLDDPGMSRRPNQLVQAFAATIFATLPVSGQGSDKEKVLDALSAMSSRMETLVARHGFDDALAGSCRTHSRFTRVSTRLPQMLRDARSPRKLVKLGNRAGGSPWRSEANCSCARKMVQLIGGDWAQVNEFLLRQAMRADREFAIRKLGWTSLCDA